MHSLWNFLYPGHIVGLHLSALCVPDVTTRDQISRPSPSVLSYCKQSNTGDGNSLGTRLGLGVGRREECLAQVDERTQID